MSFSLRRRRRRPPAGPVRQTLSGVAVLLALALAVYAVFIGNYPWSSPWTLSAVLSNSAQITAGSPVRIAGLQVGQVATVGQGPGSTALITMQIESAGRPIHADATLMIRPRLFLEGSYYVDLHPGSPSAPGLHAGATLPLPQTSVPVSFSSVLSTFTTPIRGGLVDILHGLRQGYGSGGASALGRGIRALPGALRDSAIAAQAAAGTGPDDVTRLVQGGARVTQALADEAPSLSSAILAESQLAATLASRDRDLTATVSGVDATLKAAPPALSAVARTLPATRAFATALDPSLRNAPSVLRATTALLQQVQGLVSPDELPRLISILGPLSGQIVSLAPKLQRLFPRVRMVASCAANQLVDVLDAKLNDGTLSTGQPVWQELAHVNVDLASANQNFDAGGTQVRFATSLQPNLLGLGSVPGVGVLLQNLEQPLLGIRPQWTGPAAPAAHPEVPCTSQPVGSLDAASIPVPPPTSPPVKLDVATLRSLVDGLLGEVKHLGGL